MQNTAISRNFAACCLKKISCEEVNNESPKSLLIFWNFKLIKPQNKMAGINPDYDNIGKAFTQQYYAMFDNPATRAQLVNLYNVSMTDF